MHSSVGSGELPLISSILGRLMNLRYAQLSTSSDCKLGPDLMSLVLPILSLSLHSTLTLNWAS